MLLLSPDCILYSTRVWRWWGNLPLWRLALADTVFQPAEHLAMEIFEIPSLKFFLLATETYPWSDFLLNLVASVVEAFKI